jgi:hypothetical protein
MNPNPQRQPHNQDAQDNQDAELDRLLLTHLGSSPNSPAHLIPSSGFAHSVMDAIHQQATAPPPIPFPWKRLLPSAIALLCILLAFPFLLTSQATPSLANTVSFNLTPSSPAVMTITLIALAIALSLAITAISFKLSTGHLLKQR